MRLDPYLPVVFVRWDEHFDMPYVRLGSCRDILGEFVFELRPQDIIRESMAHAEVRFDFDAGEAAAKAGMRATEGEATLYGSMEMRLEELPLNPGPAWQFPVVDLPPSPAEDWDILPGQNKPFLVPPHKLPSNYRRSRRK